MLTMPFERLTSNFSERAMSKNIADQIAVRIRDLGVETADFRVRTLKWEKWEIRFPQSA